MTDVFLTSSNGWLVQGKPFTNWNAIKPYMQYWTHDDIEDMGDMMGPAGWRLSPEGIVKAQELGYTVYINGEKLPQASTLADLEASIHTLLSDAKAKRQAEMAQKVAEKQRIEADRKAKLAAWEAGKVAVNLDVSTLRYEVKEEIVYWRNISGSSYVEWIKITNPPELCGVEGVHRADHDYDTHYDVYLLPAEIVKQLQLKTFT